MTEKREGTAVDRLRGKGAAEPETGAEAESPESTAAVELGGGTGADVTAAEEVAAISDPGRAADGLRGGLPLKGKLLVKDVKGGRAVNTGVMGAEEACGGRAMEERGFDTFRGVVRPERPDSAGLRQVDKVMGTEADVYARPNVPDRPKAPGEGFAEGAGPLKAEGVGLVGSVLISTGPAVTAGADAMCSSELVAWGPCRRAADEPQLTGTAAAHDAGVTSGEGAGKVDGVETEFATVEGRLGNMASPGVEDLGGPGMAGRA